MKRIKGFCVACIFSAALLGAPGLARAQNQQAPLSPQLKQALAGAQTPADVQNIMNQYAAQNGGNTGSQGLSGTLSKIGTAAQTGNASGLTNQIGDEVVGILGQLIASLLEKVLNGTATPQDQAQLAGLQQASDAIQSNQDQGNPPGTTAPGATAPGTTGTGTTTPGTTAPGTTAPGTTGTGTGTTGTAGNGATTGAGAGAGTTGAGAATGAGAGATGAGGAAPGADTNTTGALPGGGAGSPGAAGGISPGGITGGGGGVSGSPDASGPGGAAGGPGGAAGGPGGAAGGPGATGGTKGGSRADDLAGKLETCRGRLVIFPKPKLGAKDAKVEDAAKRVAKNPARDEKANKGEERLAKLRAKLKHDELGEGLLKVEATIIEWKRVEKALASGHAPVIGDQKNEKDDFAEVRTKEGKIDVSRCELWLVDYHRSDVKRYRLTFTAEQLDQIEPILGAQLAVKGAPAKVDDLPKGIEEDLPGDVARLDVVNVVAFVKDVDPSAPPEDTSASRKSADTTPRKPAVTGDVKKATDKPRDPKAPATPATPKDGGNEFDD
jgi:hypothetical protein